MLESSLMLILVPPVIVPMNVEVIIDSILNLSSLNFQYKNELLKPSRS